MMKCWSATQTDDLGWVLKDPDGIHAGKYEDAHIAIKQVRKSLSAPDNRICFIVLYHRNGYIIEVPITIIDGLQGGVRVVASPRTSTDE